jgi:hypothetical protein
MSKNVKNKYMPLIRPSQHARASGTTWENYDAKSLLAERSKELNLEWLGPT